MQRRRSGLVRPSTATGTQCPGAKRGGVVGNNIDLGRLEPTVLGAVRRYWLMVFGVALTGAVAAVAYSTVMPQDYRAEASVTVPQASSSQAGSGDQYPESQVLLLRSQEVADRAASLADAALGAQLLVPADFSPEHNSLKITPPDGTSSGAFGSGIVNLPLTWPDAKVAQAGANAMLQAFDGARVDAISAQAAATVAGIDKAIADDRTRGQHADLLNQRARLLVDEQMDLARHPTVVWATQPLIPVDGGWLRLAAIGLVVGFLVGAALAYLRASRRPRLLDRFAPAAIYGAPLIIELPADKHAKWAVEADGYSSHPTRSPSRRKSSGSQRDMSSGSVRRMAISCRSPSSRPVAELPAVRSSRTSPWRPRTAAHRCSPSTRSASGALTALLLPGAPPADGLDQVLTGARSVSECVQPSPLNQQLSVLGSGRPAVTGCRNAGYSRAMRRSRQGQGVIRPGPGGQPRVAPGGRGQ